MTHKKWGFLSAFAMAAVLFTGCGTTAHIEKDKTADFSKYKTYNWIPKDDKNAMNHQNDIVESNIRSSVNDQLQKNGFRQVSNNPDLLLSYDLMVDKTTREQSNAVYSQPYTRLFYNPYTGHYRNIYFPSQFVGYDHYSTPVKEGTVTISMIDSKTDKTIWQGWTTNEVNGNKVSSKEIERDVKSIFKKFDIQRR